MKNKLVSAFFFAVSMIGLVLAIGVFTSIDASLALGQILPAFMVGLLFAVAAVCGSYLGWYSLEHRQHLLEDKIMASFFFLLSTGLLSIGVTVWTTLDFSLPWIKIFPPLTLGACGLPAAVWFFYVGSRAFQGKP